LKLLDFGVAKGPADGVAAIGDESLSCAGAIFGTPDTMAPEQITGGKVDGRADLYALGCVLYELVTGRMPFDAPTAILLMSCHLRQPPTPPRLAAPERGIPEAVERAILRAMKKDAADRFANAAELREALEEACFSAFYAEASTLAGSDVARSGHVVKAVDAHGESVDVMVDDERGSTRASTAPRSASRTTIEVLDDDLRPMSDASLSAIALGELDDEDAIEEERARKLAARRRVVRPIGYLAIGGFGALALAALAQTHGQLSREEAVARFHDGVGHVAEIARDVAHRFAPEFVADPKAVVAAAPTPAVAIVEAVVDDDAPPSTFRVVDAEMPARLLARLNAMTCEVPLRCDDDAAAIAPRSTNASPIAMSPALAELPAARPTLADAEAKLAAHDAKGALAIARTLKQDATLGSTRIWAKSAYAAAEMREAHDAAQAWIARAPDSDDDGLPARILDARALIALGRLDDARARLDATLKTHPKSQEAKSLVHDLDRIEKISSGARLDHPVAPPHPRTARPQTKHRVAEKAPSKGQP
jgi:tetratricopeptide (TPR) repeat protein